jgi:hypothetical protein
MVTRNLPVPSENRGGSCNERNAVHEIYGQGRLLGGDCGADTGVVHERVHQFSK